MALSTLIPLLLFLPAPSRPSPPQGPGVPTVPLPPADRVIFEPFSQIAGARELGDGRLVVSDRVEDRVVAIDAAGRIVRIGGVGGGPAEYRRPGALIPLRGDTLLLVDEGNERLQLIVAGRTIVRTLRLEANGVPVGITPRGVDPQGRYYAQVPHWAAGAFGAHGDSIPIVRVTPGDPRPEILTWVLGIADPPGQVRYGLPYVPFSPADGWAYAPDGSLVIARVADFHVERWRGGRVSRGPATPFTALPVTDTDKVDYTLRFMQSSGVSGRGAGGGVGAVPDDWMSPQAIRHLVETNLYAKTKPPFTERAPLLAPNGELWVERSMPLGAAGTWCVFDVAGRLVRQVTLPAAHRLLEIGRSGVYLVATDEDGVERLERHPYPAASGTH